MCNMKQSKRFVGVLLMIIVMVFTMLMCFFQVKASTTNLILNGDFENNQITPWSGYGIGVANYGAYAGTKCMYVEGTREATQIVTGLKSNTTYELKAFVKVGASNDKIILGAKNYGSSISKTSTSMNYNQLSMTFTTGSSNTSATIYISRHEAGQWSWGYADNITLTEVGSTTPPSVILKNGGFESGSTDWELDSAFTVVTNNARSGSRALKMSGTGGWSNASQIINVTKNSNYKVTFYAKGSGATQLKIFTTTWGDVAATTKWPGSSYTKYELDFNSGNNTSLRVAFQDAAGGTLYIDDVSVMGSSSSTIPSPVGPSGNWNLKFNDEFNGSSLDNSKWNVGWPWGNSADHADEVIRASNITVNNGILQIKANKEGSTWYSGLIQTNGKHNQQYGYWEARIKSIGNTPGFLTAFWACTNESWPPEIDFVEILGNDPTAAHVTQHYTNSSGQYGVDGYEWHAGVDLSLDYHVYGCEWNANQIKYYIDGNLVATFANKINEPLYTLLNMHVGMDWTGDPTTTADQFMYVDWVRIWQK